MEILLVDDEDQFRESIMRQLSIRGYIVNEVSSGEEAVLFLDQNKVDVVVLDMRMPGICGTDTLKEIKKQSPLTEVIMLTGNATVCTAMDTIKAGAFDYITKPVKLDELINKMEDAYKQKKLRQKKFTNKEKTDNNN